MAKFLVRIIKKVVAIKAQGPHNGLTKSQKLIVVLKKRGFEILKPEISLEELHQ